MSHIKKHIIIGNVECKVCNKCGQALPLSEFSRHARTFDGYQVTCKTCYRALNEQSRSFRQEIKAERKAIEAENRTTIQLSIGSVLLLFLLCHCP